MRQQLHYLEEGLMSTGFGELLSRPELFRNIRADNSKFVLVHELAYDTGKMRYELSIQKGQRDFYFFTKFDALLIKPNGVEVGQRFFLTRSRADFTMKESYNLLDSRAVHKQFDDISGKTDEVWLALDFTKSTITGNYEIRRFSVDHLYNLGEILQNYPVLELKNQEQKDVLLTSLREGNLQPVRWINANDNSKRFLAADPQNYDVKIYDNNFKEIKTDKSTKENIRSGMMHSLVKNRVGAKKGLGR